MKTTLEPTDSSFALKTTRKSAEFSLVLGGPLFWLCRRTHLAGDALQFLHREVVAITLLTWLPLLLLSTIERHATGGAIRIPIPS